MRNAVAAARQRHQARYYEDGLRELLQAVNAAGIAPLLLVLGSGTTATAIAVGVLLVSLVISASEERILVRVRERITWPRVGFAEELPPSWSASRPMRRLPLAILLVLTVAVTAAAFWLLATGAVPVTGFVPSVLAALTWLPALFGAGMASVTLYEAQRLRGRRIGLATAPLYLVVGLASSVSAEGVLAGLGLFMAGVAVIQVGSGLFTLQRFLKLPVVGEQGEE